MDPIILEEIRKRFYYVSHKLGGPESFLQLLSMATHTSPLSIEEKVHRILSHRDRVGMITPWDPVIDLTIEEEDISPILPGEAYRVTDMYGRLIYKVFNHDGTYGGSIMDKSLILSSDTGDMYYLQFPTYRGERTILLLINNLALAYSNPIEDRDPLRAPPPPSVEPSNNYITLDCSSVITNRSSTIGIFTSKASPTLVPNSSDIYRAGNVEREEHFLTRGDSIILYFPKVSGWVSVGLIEDNTIRPLYITNVIGAGVDRFIQANREVWYVAVGEEMNINSIRQSLGLISRRPPDVSTANIIRLSGEVRLNA